VEVERAGEGGGPAAARADDEDLRGHHTTSLSPVDGQGEGAPRVDVVVVGWGAGELLRPTVEPLAGTSGLRVVVVDNGCPAGSSASVHDLPVTILRTPNEGWGPACNAGAATGDAPAILILNPDMRIAPEDVARLAARLLADPVLAAVGPRVVRADGGVDRTIGRTPDLRVAFGTALFLHRVFRRRSWPSEWVQTGYDREQRADWLVGGCLCLRRSALTAVGGFDPRLFVFGEDVDLGTRLRRAGYALLYSPVVTVRHVASPTTPSSHVDELLAEGRVRYARLHECGPRYAGFRVAYALREVVRAPVDLVLRRRLRSRLRAIAVTLGRPAGRVDDP
jgi:GT2 family glycosyltransferase